MAWRKLRRSDLDAIGGECGIDCGKHLKKAEVIEAIEASGRDDEEIVELWEDIQDKRKREQLKEERELERKRLELEIARATASGGATLSAPVMKPLMEKRRRARINNCLSELKRFLMANDGGTFEKQSSRSQRVEKADILEMTVKFLRQRQLHIESDSQEEVERTQRFHDGYRHCVFEVSRYANAMEPRLRDTLLTHLQSRLHHLAASTGGTGLQQAYADEAVSSTNSDAHDLQPGRRSPSRLHDYGYEAGSVSDVSEEESSSSDYGDAASPDAELFLRSGCQDEPRDYRLHRDEGLDHDGSNEPMWRPW
ncbi:hypothetical protein MTO96_009498 [Rhipicephalus appendiculatus]